WGTALATVLAENGCRQVALWSRSRQDTERMATTRENTKYLPGVTLANPIHPTDDLFGAINGAKTVVFAVPSHAIREIVQEVADRIDRSQVIIHAAKGFELSSLKRMSQVLSEELTTHK